MTTQTQAIRTAAQIRQEFIDYFAAKHGHTFVPSSPVVPLDDPTLLFTNAGMNQFKEIFLGYGRRDYTRAVNTQKCIRAGGKHNDLEDVGKDHYHHTFFEMLGNWSFGDYFKAEAIEWAWNLLTNVWGLDKDRLHVTVFEGNEAEGIEPDIEAEEIWKRFVPANHISRWGKKDNFWEMGETGPCGPCSEIHYNFGDVASGAKLVNAGDPQVVELWNLVFIQFNRAPGTKGKPGALSPLPAKHVDTGMGLERLVRILQNVDSNYDTDLWTPIFEAIQRHTGAHPYQGSLDDPVDVAYRVIADHIRCLTFAITDGAWPSNEGRGYVLRRILRRAVRHSHQTLKTKGAWLYELVPAVIDSLSEAFPELNNKPDKVAAVIRDEEEGFLRTLDRGIALFEEAYSRAIESVSIPRLVPHGSPALDARKEVMRAKKAWQQKTPNVMWAGKAQVSAEYAFKLHDTYGFPIDLTRIMAEEQNMNVDEVGFEKLMDEARQRSRGAARDLDDPFDVLDSKQLKACDDSLKYVEPFECAAFITSLPGSTKPFDTDSAKPGQEIVFTTNRTPFYAEQGGQVSDTGTVHTDDGEMLVTQVHQRGDYIVHIGRVTKGEIVLGEICRMKVDRPRRLSIMQNHTATHLLNFALRAVIGPEEDQKGSLVAPDRLRFDFSSSHAMTSEQIEQTERLVNADIQQELEVYDEVVPLSQAKAIASLRAVFGEKYPDPVRVVSIGVPLKEVLADPSNEQWKEFSIELCGGTHLRETGEATRFIITHEQALAAGVRRIIALTGPAALAAEAAGNELESRARRASELDDAQLPAEFDEITKLLDQLSIGAVAHHRIEALLEPLKGRIKELRRQARAESRSNIVDQARDIAASATGSVIVELLLGADKETLRTALDTVRAKHTSAAVMLFTVDDIESKVSIVARVPEALIEKGLKAGDWVREAAKACGGSGGGRADMAQAGGKNPDKVPDAISIAKRYAQKILQ
ncbi:MAG: alanine--tRNA ligase [Planctomycetes bacterium]|nr:alanine--tRNA ligase [Planctomycetota bacterium]